jgi:hypothetical protein
MKHTILFLAANPLSTDRLALDREARAIQVELERSGFRDSFELVTRWAVEPLDLLRELRKLKPSVVHFSGHGSRGIAGARGSAAGPHRDALDPGEGAALGAVVEPCAVDGGLLFQGADGQPQRVSTAALRDTFDAAGASVKLVVLGACYSEPQAAALLGCVDCVVGMRGSIGDDAARSFAIGFYGGLGDRESVATAFKQGCAAIRLQGLPDADLPKLQVRPGVDAARLILASVPAATDVGPGRSDGFAATPPRAEAAPTTRDELLARMSSLLPSQFEMVLFRARIPMAQLSGAGAPQAMRAMEAIRHVEQQGRLPQLAAIVQEVTAGPR